MILATALPWLSGVFVLSLLLAAYRLLRGPALGDGIRARDTLYVLRCAGLFRRGLEVEPGRYFEAALLSR